MELTQNITTTKINDLLQKTSQMSNEEMKTFLEQTRALFNNTYEIQKLLIKHVSPNIPDVDCHVNAYDNAWEIMKRIGYTYSTKFNGWIRKSMMGYAN